jgi:sugar phosphate isomerase/epimerase
LGGDILKIGIKDGKKWGDQHYLKLRSFGFNCYDFNMSNINGLPYIYEGKEFEDYLKNQKRLADEAGITIWQAHGPWRGPHEATPEDRAEQLEIMTRSVQAASILGAKYWVVHPIMPFGLHDLKTGHAEQTKELALEFMKKLSAVGKREGVIVCVENMPFSEYSLSSPTSIAELVAELNDPYFAMCLDTGHANICPDWLTPAETVRKFRQYVKMLHVHDNNGEFDEHLHPFSGTIDWKDFSSALREVNFSGAVSLECCPSDNLPDDIYEDMYVLFCRMAKAISTGSF